MSIQVNNVSFCYNRGTSLEKYALENINFSIGKGEFVLIAGEVGSGKSTLIRLMNGILEPQTGSVTVSGIDSRDRRVRSKVGLLMQYPQKQLFGRTVNEDISFGPSNFGLKGEALNERVREALDLVGLDENISDLSPFSLSGGHMRLVAMAGVLAMRPEYLILDEPTSGLDPENHKLLLSSLSKLHSSGISIIVVSHQICSLLPFVEKVIHLKGGNVDLIGTPYEYINMIKSPLPEITSLMKELRLAGFNVRDDIYTVDDAFLEITRELGKRRAEKFG